MDYSYCGVAFLITFFVLMVLSIAIGNVIGKNKLAASGFNVTEGAVFTLMALLVAFTFSGAAQRFDQRRMMIVEEANAISTAYSRLSILQPNDRVILKSDFIAFVDSQIAIYNAVPNMDLVNRELEKTAVIENQLWSNAVNACLNSKMQFAPMLVLPPINTMFDVANSRVGYSNLHVSYLVFGLLVIVALLSGFLTGYGIAGKGTWRSLHVLAFVLIITLTIYVIFDLEMPRIGLIKETGFDSFLVDVKNNISQKD